MTKRQKENYIKELEQHTHEDLVFEIIVWIESSMKFEKQIEDLEEQIKYLEDEVNLLEKEVGLLEGDLQGCNNA